jgi:hypothetical protein
VQGSTEFMQDDVEVSKYWRSRYHLEDISEKYEEGMRVLLRLCEGELKILEAPWRILKAKHDIINIRKSQNKWLH